MNNQSTVNLSVPSLIAALDMYGCPNRCRHCWLGHSANPRLTTDDLVFVRDSFRPFTDHLEVDTWMREPDYASTYRELWDLREQLSDSVQPHFELMSVWRAVRDPAYIPWLYGMGVRRMQLTFFGGETLTDYYTGRRGAWQDLLRSLDLLLDNGIVPRIQIFLNQQTVQDLQPVIEMIRNCRLEERCASLGESLEVFVHTGGCDGENRNQYPIWLRKEDLDLIPEYLVQKTLAYTGAASFSDLFGKSEREWVKELSSSKDTENLALRHSDPAVFYVTSDFSVYPNFSAPAPYWKLGNLKTDPAGQVLERYLSNDSPAQNARLTVPLGKMISSFGNPRGEGLFQKDDYITY
ncbi:MAG: hypothetical protein II781_02255, partial [Clostridia bacterium]|nr:hypothetical protein [Clostridia bacterium]